MAKEKKGRKLTQEKERSKYEVIAQTAHKKMSWANHKARGCLFRHVSVIM